jgi:TrmH family RNA methyltransferase
LAKVIKIYTENNHFQHIEVLKRNREKRNFHKKAFVEGVKCIDRVISNNWCIDSIVFSRDKALSSWAENILMNLYCDFHYELPQKLMDKISDKEEGSELICIVKLPEFDLSRIKIKDDLLVVIFDRPSNPGNLGTVIRSADSFKADGLIVTGHSVDIYDPTTIRSSIGAIFALPVFRVDKREDLMNWFESIRKTNPSLQVVGTTARTEKLITEMDFKKPTILLLGNETDGLSKSYKAICDELVKIPIYGSSTSLNVGCCASISLYEIDRQRRGD